MIAGLLADTTLVLLLARRTGFFSKTDHCGLPAMAFAAAVALLLTAWSGGPATQPKIRTDLHNGLSVLMELSDDESQSFDIVEQLPMPPDDAGAEEVVEFCMKALQENDSPVADAGKWTNWKCVRF